MSLYEWTGWDPSIGQGFSNHPGVQTAARLLALLGTTGILFSNLHLHLSYRKITAGWTTNREFI